MRLVLLLGVILTLAGCNEDSISDSDDIIISLNSSFTIETEIVENTSVVMEFKSIELAEKIKQSDNNIDLDIINRCILYIKSEYNKNFIMGDIVIYDIDLDGNDELLILDYWENQNTIYCFRLVNDEIIYLGYIEFSLFSYAFNENILDVNLELEPFKIDIRVYNKSNKEFFPVICSTWYHSFAQSSNIFKFDFSENKFDIQNFLTWGLDKSYDENGIVFTPYYKYFDDDGTEIELTEAEFNIYLNNII